MITHKITDTYVTDAGVIASAMITYTGDVEQSFDGSIPGTTTNEAVNLNWTFAKVQSMMLWASAALTVKTNSSSAPTTTINLVAGQLINWGLDHTEAAPIPGDVTGGLFITNAGSGAVSLKIRVCLNY